MCLDFRVCLSMSDWFAVDVGLQQGCLIRHHCLIASRIQEFKRMWYTEQKRSKIWGFFEELAAKIEDWVWVQRVASMKE